MTLSYSDFLKSKIITAPCSGFYIEDTEMNPALKPHQKDVVKWAVSGGRRALFEAFGLGKTVQELEICRIISEHENGKALIILPLGVKQEFIRDAINILGWERAPEYIRTRNEVIESDNDILLTNYERVRDGDISPADFVCICLDEASVLRSFGSKTYQEFLKKFKGVKYKYVATATPDPNRYKELIHYAGFLEVMDTGQALTRFFQRNSTKANDLTLYPHKEEEFWAWCASWGAFLQMPSDLGHSDEGYDLPPIEIRYHCLPPKNYTREDKRGQMRLLSDAAEGLTQAAKEKRESLEARIEKTCEIVNESPTDNFILWHDLEDERKALKKALPECVEVYGQQEYELREKNVIAFSEGEVRLLATKKEISGQGCNFQRHCHRAIFVGIDYKFNDFIQAIHRIYRFLQKERVIIDIIYTENEKAILRDLLAKWERHKEQAQKMQKLIREYGLNGDIISDKMSRSIGVKRVEIKGNNFTAINNDCIEETKRMAANSIDLICTSIPFSNHYEYTPSYNDFGHNEDNAKFFEQMDYLTPELLRVLSPGRIAAVHVKDRILFGNATGDGMPTLDPFSDMTVFHFLKHGFKYVGRIVVLTDVVRENNQTYRLGWSEQCKDGSKMGVGCPEYVLIFRKLPTDTSKAYADIPVTKNKNDYTRAQWQLDAHALYRSSGDRLLTKEEILNIPTKGLQKAYTNYSRNTVYDYKEHCEIARSLDEQDRLPATFMVVAPASWSVDIWDDINRMRTLNTTQSQRKQQMHVCPLQLDIIERIINRYSNEGEKIYDPFGGIMSVPMTAVKMGRYGIGCELNSDYFRDGVGYLKEADSQRDFPTLLDFLND